MKAICLLIWHLHCGFGMHLRLGKSEFDLQFNQNDGQKDFYIKSEADYYKYFASEEKPGSRRYTRSADSERPGEPNTTSSCCYVREVPDGLRHPEIMGPNGLDRFYSKYTEAYGIPVISSKTVSDDALRRACYVLRFMLADNKAVRRSYYKMFGRVAIIGASEQTLDIPEHRWLPDSLNERARGLGATEYAPVCTAGEENAICFCNDRYFLEDIFVHEIAHGVHILGAKHAIPKWNDRLNAQFRRVNGTALWKDTYALESPMEYFAEGVQSFFNVNVHNDKANGVHGPISFRERLRQKDPVLYRLIQEIFPCGNNYLKRCESTRGTEMDQELKMDCDLNYTGFELNSYDESDRYGLSSRQKCKGECFDKDTSCVFWASIGECNKNPNFMLYECQMSCKVCESGKIIKGCIDGDSSCKEWANLGECKRNAEFMLIKCAKSCDSCRIVKEDKNTSVGESNKDVDTPGADVTISFGRKTTLPTTTTTPTPTKALGVTAIDCQDSRRSCKAWAANGECRRNPGYMIKNCPLSCDSCSISRNKSQCTDENRLCKFWAKSGECRRNPAYMLRQCRKSCAACQDSDTEN